MSAALAFDDVTCARGGRVLFEGLSFQLAAGDAALVRGPNGAGKSSLIRLAARLLAPAAGHVATAGGRALMAEAAGFDLDRRLADALGFWAALDGEADPPGRVAEALAATALEHLADVPFRLLSTGQRRRAALARVLATHAPVWLLDEPANGMDADAVLNLEALIAGHRAGGGIALIATHLPVTVPGAQVVELAA